MRLLDDAARAQAAVFAERSDYDGRDGMYFDIDGSPITLWEWVALMERRRPGALWREAGGWRVGWDGVSAEHVSTVWLGLDHGWGRGAPIIFESLVCGGLFDGTMRRYSTLEQARAGH